MAKSRAQRLNDAANAVRANLPDIEAIHEELDNWRNSLEDTNLEGSATYEKLEENLEEIQENLDTISYALDAIVEIELAQGFGRD